MTTAPKTFLFGAVVGAGLTAKAADKAGADYLLALNAGRFRVQGASSLTSFLPVRPANDWVMEFAEREMLGRSTAPIYAGFSVSDPTLDIDALIARTKKIGFAGVCNFPSTTSIDGRLGALFEREGLGFARELELVRKATDAGLGTFVYVQTNAQAREMVDAGASAICVNIGFTGGATGVSTHLTLEAAAARIDRVLEGVPMSVDRLCHGGPIISPEHALALTRICGVQGFVAGSTLDRIPLEQTLNEVTKGFTAIPSLSRVRASAGDPQLGLIGSSQAMQHIREEIEDLAFDDIPVLITGETGTGKSLAARCLHESGPTASRAPVLVDCAALDGEDGGAHLLGRAAGGRSGTASHRGALEQAANSTIIFEEINALLLEHQGKILKFVDEGIVQRIGDHTVRDVSARVVSTTTADRFALADGGGLRRDLYYRVSGHIISIPPLRDRVDDIPELAFHLGRRLMSDEAPKFSNAAMRRLLEYGWPGNVRELKYAVMRALRQSNGATVGLKAVEFLLQSPALDEVPNINIAPERLTSERDVIMAALSRNGFRRAETALELGVTTRTLYNKIKKFGLQT